MFWYIIVYFMTSSFFLQNGDEDLEWEALGLEWLSVLGQAFVFVRNLQESFGLKIIGELDAPKVEWGLQHGWDHAVVAAQLERS